MHQKLNVEGEKEKLGECESFMKINVQRPFSHIVKYVQNCSFGAIPSSKHSVYELFSSKRTRERKKWYVGTTASAKLVISEI